MKYIILLIFLGLLRLDGCKGDWDFLIFSQRWPITACIDWKDRSKNNTCVFSQSEGSWTVHGIWPTKEGTKGPWNCNGSWHFVEDLLNPIKLELEEYWTNVEGNTPLASLWKHEWIKHGTCAATLPHLNSELKYFNQGIKWLQTFNMKNVLSVKQIFPNKKEYSVQEVFDSVQLELGKTPIIQCIINRHTKQSLITEIRICFNRELNLIDCEAVKDFGDFDVIGNILTNCNVSKPLIYPDSVEPYTTTTITPTLTIHSPMESNWSLLYSAREKLVTIYKSVQLLMWLTF